MDFKKYYLENTNIEEAVGTKFSYEELVDAVDKVKKQIKVPEIGASVSTLGGKDRASLMIRFSLDQKKNWANNIFQNSRYAMLSLDYNGVLTMFNRSYTIPIKPLRKSTPKSIDDAIKKINDWVKKAQAAGIKEDVDEGELEERVVRKRVVRKGKRVLKYTTNREGYKVVRDTRTGNKKEVRITPQERMKRKRSAKIGARKAKGKSKTAARKRLRSISKRGGLK